MEQQVNKLATMWGARITGRSFMCYVTILDSCVFNPLWKRSGRNETRLLNINISFYPSVCMYLSVINTWLWSFYFLIPFKTAVIMYLWAFFMLIKQSKKSQQAKKKSFLYRLRKKKSCENFMLAKFINAIIWYLQMLYEEIYESMKVEEVW